MNVMREPIDREQSTYYYDVRSVDIRAHLLKLLRPHRYYLYYTLSIMDGGYQFGATSADLRGGKAKEVLDVRSRDILCGCAYQEFDDCVRIR